MKNKLIYKALMLLAGAIVLLAERIRDGVPVSTGLAYA